MGSSETTWRPGHGDIGRGRTEDKAAGQSDYAGMQKRLEVAVMDHVWL